MNDAFNEVITSLESLESFINTHTENRILSEVYGFNYPALYVDDFVDMVISVKKRIISYGDIELTDDEVREIGYLPTRITQLLNNIAPQLFNGANGIQAIPAFMATFAFINNFLDELFSLERLDKTNLIPRNLSRRVKSLNARIDEIAPGVDKIEEKIKVINDAHTAAENIPIDLEELRSYNKDAESLRDKIQKLHFGLESSEVQGQDTLEQLKDKNLKADEYLALCEEAIRASTSKGLAGAFEIKAHKLTVSMWIWVGGLLLALGAGGIIGFERLIVLSKTLEMNNPSAAVIFTQLTLSIFSVGAPLWFAWISTKQINQRFKLAEDYAFKSAVAKAYEGYKNEASRVSDGNFEKRLFDSALSRLEEAPLRLLSQEEHSTPWSELLKSKSFQNFLDASIDNVNLVKNMVNRNPASAVTASASNDDSVSKNA